MIILLDLNYTLVSNSHVKKQPFQRQIDQETYDRALLDLVREHRVFLITARPVKYREPTLARILAVEGWQPERSYWNDWGMRPPAVKKAHLLEGGLLEEFGADSFFAIESNPITRGMYRNQGIKAVPKAELKYNGHPEGLDIPK